MQYKQLLFCVCVFIDPYTQNTCFSLFLYVNITTATNKWGRQVLLTQEALFSIAGAEHFYHFLCITISPTCFTLFAYPGTLSNLVRQKGLTPAKFFSTLSALKSSTGSWDRALLAEFHCSQAEIGIYWRTSLLSALLWSSSVIRSSEQTLLTQAWKLKKP